MMIQANKNKPFFSLLPVRGLQSPQAVDTPTLRTEVATESVSLSHSVERPSRPIPSPKAAQLSDPNPRARVKETIAAWMAKNAPAADDKETLLWEGLADWRAGISLDQAKSEWGVRGQDAITNARTMWALADETYALRDESVHQVPYPGWHQAVLPNQAKALMGMLAGQVGEARLVEAFDRFVANRAGQATSAWDLFAALPPVHGRSAREVMAGWLDQPHFPKIDSYLREDSSGTKLEVRQKSWKLYPDTKGGFEQSWSIPLAIKFQDDEGVKVVSTVLDPTEHEISLPAKGKVRWFYPNGGGTGVFRTGLSEKDYRALEGQGLAHLTSSEKFAFVANQWRLVRHGEVSVGSFLSLARKAAQGADDDMLALLKTEVRYLSSYRVTPEDRPAFDRAVRDILGPGMIRLGFNRAEGEPRHRQALRVECLELLVAAADPKATAHIRESLAAFRAGEPNELVGDPEQADRWGVMLGDEASVRRGLSQLKSGQADTPSGVQLLEKVSFLLRSPAAQGEVLDWILSAPPEKEVALWAITSSGERSVRDEAFAYFQQNLATLPEDRKASWLRVLAGGTERERLRTLITTSADEKTREFFENQVDRDEVRHMGPVTPGISQWLREQGYAEEPHDVWLLA